MTMPVPSLEAFSQNHRDATRDYEQRYDTQKKIHQEPKKRSDRIQREYWNIVARLHTLRSNTLINPES
jgi:hypothetical protein